MASDFSSECNDAIATLDDEKEEGELSFDDVSSSEEGHLNYRCMEKFRDGRSQHCPPCEKPVSYNSSKLLHKKDAEQGKENHHLIKDTGYSGDRLTSSTLQEKNDDLIPISSDSDMELVGLPIRVHRVKSSKVKKKKKKRRNHTFVLEKDVEPIVNETPEHVTILKRNSTSSKENRLLKIHHREVSPIHRMKTSPRRHRSPGRVRPVVKKIKSPSTIQMKKHLKRLKSPEKEAHKNVLNPHYKKIRKRQSPDFISSPSSDIHVTRLLKKVRQLDMIGTMENSENSNKNKDHGSSLKEKLNNILKPTSENNDSSAKDAKNDSDENKIENVEEEEDLITLRQKALETKHKKVSKNQESSNIEEEVKENSNIETEDKGNEEEIIEKTSNEEDDKRNTNNEDEEEDDDDDDNEDLKLRLIALRSAVYKKYRNRIAKSQKDKGTLPPRSNSPFSESFINNISLAEDVEEPSSNSSETAKDSNNSIEDMELDSDIERDIILEKGDKEINFEKSVNVTDNNFENNVNLEGSENFERITNLEAPYSPTDDVNSELILEAEQLGIDTSDVSLININSKSFCQFGSYLPSSVREKSPPFENTFNTLSISSNSNIDARTISKDTQNQFNFERPYSPSDAPIFDPDLSNSLLPLSNILENYSQTLDKNNVGSNNNNNSFFVNNQLAKEPEVILIDDDDLPETDIDGSPLVPMEKDFSTHYHIPEHLSYQMLQPSYQPLYLRNHRDVIHNNPAIIYKSLVPQSVLRVSQQLQQESKVPLRSAKETGERMYKNSSMPPMNLELMGEHFNSSQLHQTAKRPIINSLAVDQVDNQPSKENVSINFYEDEFNLDFGKSKKKVKRKRKKSKRNLTECEEIDLGINTNEVQEVSQDQNKIDKRLKISDIRMPSNDNNAHKSSIDKNLEINVRRDIEDIVMKYTENFFRECGENSLRKNAENVGKDGENILGKDGESNLRNDDRSKLESEKNLGNRSVASQSANHVENDGTHTNSIANVESRRNSIDEDEDELRAILLASMGKRTKSPKIDKQMVTRSKEVVTNVTANKPSSDTPMQIFSSVRVSSNETSTKGSSGKETYEKVLSTKETSSKVLPTEETSSKVLPTKETSSKVLSSKEISAKVSPPNETSARVLSSKETLAKLSPTNVSLEKVVPTKVMPPKILTTEILPLKTSSPKVMPTKVLPTKVSPPEVLPTQVSSVNVLPSKVVPDKVLPDKVSKILPNKVSSTKVLPTKVSPQKTLPTKVATGKVVPLKINPTKVISTKVTPVKVAPTKVTPAKILSNKVLTTKVTINNSLAMNSILGKRKGNTILVSGTPRKLVRKTVIPASTKVVNNAKRYQNSLMQKRLNLQKAITTFNSKKIIANNKSLRVVNLKNQNNRSISPNIPTANQSERFIISLNSDSESDSESERRNTIVAVTNNSSVEKPPPLVIPTTEFERSVDQFLRDVRKKQESAAATKHSTNTGLAKTLTPPECMAKGKKVTTTITPLAVRHLPVSQQEEYHRLKQQIVEREKLKAQRTTVPQQTPSSNTAIPPDSLSSTGPTTCSTTNSASSSSTTTTKTIATSTKISATTTTAIATELAAATTKATAITKTITNNISKTPSITKTISNDNSSSTNSSCPSLTPQFKPNLTIQIKNTVTPPKKSTINLIPEKPKPPTFPKLRILTCEQINLKLFQIQVSQNDEGRKIIVSDIISPIHSPKSKNERSKQNNVEKNTKNSVENTNLDTDNLNDSIVILSEKRCDSRVNNESNVQKSVDTETSTVALSKNSTTLTNDNSSSITLNTISENSPVSEKEKEISTKITEVQVSKDVSTSKDPKEDLFNDSNSGKKSVAEKESIAVKNVIVEKEVTQEKIVEKESIAEEGPTVSKSVESVHKDSSTANSNLKDNNDVRTETESSGKEKPQEVWDVIKNNVQAEVKTVSKLGKEEMKRKLVETEQELITKRYEVLDDLVEVSKSLRQWELEKDLQGNLTDEVKKLLEQLKQTEERLQEQKDKVASMGLKVSTVHEKMNVGRKECFRLSKICTGIGNRVFGQKYKVPEEGVQLVNNRLKEVAQHTSQLCKKKNNKRRKISVTSDKSNGKQSDVTSNQVENSTNSKVTNSINSNLLQPCFENVSSPIERQNSYESISSYGKSSNTGSNGSGDVSDQTEIDKEQDNSSQNKIVTLDVQNSSERLNSCSSVSDNVPQTNVEQTNKDKEKNSNENSKNIDSNSRMENIESSVTCHTVENSVQNKINGADNQTKKKTMLPYVSILDHMKTSRNSRSDGILCPYQLMGSCQDADCQYVHHTPSH